VKSQHEKSGGRDKRANFAIPGGERNRHVAARPHGSELKLTNSGGFPSNTSSRLKPKVRHTFRETGKHRVPQKEAPHWAEITARLT
jgi:hypothetical protein